jgi:hypothetical protein
MTLHEGQGGLSGPYWESQFLDKDKSGRLLGSVQHFRERKKLTQQTAKVPKAISKLKLWRLDPGWNFWTQQRRDMFLCKNRQQGRTES